MNSSNDVFVRTERLTKIFDGKVAAVRGVGFKVRRGALTALPGPN